MSYEYHARRELELLGKSEELIEAVIRCTKIIDSGGHSGGSMGIVVGMLKSLAKAGPKRLTEEFPKDAVLYDFVEYLKTLSLDIIEEILEYIPKVMWFQPLSPLTGEDSEWSECSTGGYQNRRCSHVFKDKERFNGQAYDIDARHMNHPGYNHRHWAGYTSGGMSSKDVTFPYIPSTHNLYFYSEASRTLLEDSFDKKALARLWLQLSVSGIDPEHNTLINDAVLMTEEEAVQALINYKEKVKGKSDLTDEYSFSYDVEQTPAMMKAERFVGLLGYESKEVEESIYDIHGMQFYFRMVPVLIPNKYYQKWIPLKFNGKEIFTWILTLHSMKDREEAYCIDRLIHRLGTLQEYMTTFQLDNTNKFNYVAVAGDTDNYLYEQRRKYGFAHPKRKSARLGNDECGSEAVVCEEPVVDSEGTETVD